MEVKSVAPASMDRITKKSLEEPFEGGGRVLQFKRHLSNESEQVYTEHIKSLISDIEKQGTILCRRADMGELQKYREMITCLMNETVSNGFAFHKEGRIGFNGRNKVFATVRRINEKLDEMTQKILNTEKTNLNLLNDVDDIRGLLVDMYF
jgi:uncharacterized protein YaaR (DUF327 family)